MNPLLKEAAEGIRLGWILGIMTALFLGSFIFWTWWAWSSKNKARMEADSRLPFNNGGES